MELIDIALSATKKSDTYNYRGDGFWYKTGSVPAGQDFRIVVTPDGGNGIRLSPGQHVRLDRVVESWQITSYDGTSTLAGEVVIGTGDFGDDNTSNLITLGASAVPNSAALPVQKQALSTITTFAPVTINTGAAQALVSDATQRQLRIHNTHASANLYLGGSTVTTANAAMVIGPGATWIEEEAPGAAWYATSDTAGTSVSIMGLKL